MLHFIIGTVTQMESLVVRFLLFDSIKINVSPVAEVTQIPAVNADPLVNYELDVPKLKQPCHNMNVQSHLPPPMSPNVG